MIKEWQQLNANAKKSCAVDFFWNLGRTLPHAILTVFLMENAGCSITQVAFLQGIFMVAAMLSEFPSGLLSDLIGRKTVFLLSELCIILSYLLIYLYNNYFIILCLAYLLYGLSVSLKSGTIEADVILEIRDKNQSVEPYTTMSQYAMSISAIIGGVLGGQLFIYFHQTIYLISLFLYVISLLIAARIHSSTAIVSNDALQTSQRCQSATKEVEKAFKLICRKKVLVFVVIMSAWSTLFSQPFFQYWQILYRQYKVPEQFFSFLYLLFQVCNVIGTALCSKLQSKNLTKNVNVILFFIPIIFGLALPIRRFAMVALPIVVILYYMFSLYLEVLIKKYAPSEYISSYISLVGTVTNIVSLGSLYLMTYFSNKNGVEMAYFMLFTIFAIGEILIQVFIRDINSNR